MKMQIIDCLSGLVRERFGKEKWEEILNLSGMGKGSDSFKYFVGFDIIDEKAMDIIQNTCKALNLSVQQAADAFGDYWVNRYAPEHYPQYYERFKSARAFIMGIDQVHQELTENLENAHPPRFDIEELDGKTLKVRYKSKRKMLEFYIGLAKGIGKYFNTEIEVRALSDEYVEIRFP